jgi:acetyltransferase
LQPEDGTLLYRIPRYPVEWIDRFAVRGGRSVTIRPVLPQDAELERLFVSHGLTPTSRYQRFHTAFNEMPEALLRQFTQVDYRRHFALIAEVFESGEQVQVADARYVLNEAGQAEFALAVADNWQSMGIGRRLLPMLVAAARHGGAAGIFGDVLATNARMLALAREAGFNLGRHPEEERLLRISQRWKEVSAPASADAMARLSAGGHGEDSHGLTAAPLASGR